MPRENRKRGKKNKKKAEEDPFYEDVKPAFLEQEPEPTGEPSWIVAASTEEINPEAPFGYVDADVKAYFRTVDVQIRDWQESQDEVVGEDEDIDPNEQRRLFFVAALTEMHGKEKQLATDPDCSAILERMSYSMDDFVRRVFVDSLAGSYEKLVKHRFASHVCQTLFSIARDTVSRETRGIFPAIPENQEKGELRTLTSLVLDICEELLPSFASLLMDPFASHVVRALLVLLSPSLSSTEDSPQSAVRSKRSAAWKAKQGPMKSVFDDDKGKGKEAPTKSTPPEFCKMARRFVEVLREQLGDNEVRALAASKVASPSLQMMLEVEADQNMGNEPGSLMDRVMFGIITSCREDPQAIPEESDYLGTLLRDTTSSHLLETIALHCPEDAFTVLWKVYFKGKLARLSNHPVANFVLAKAIERVSADQLADACAEMDGVWGKVIRASRSGVLRAVIDRAATLGSLGREVGEAIYSAFDLSTPEEHLLLVSCVISLLPLQEYQLAVASRSNESPKKEQSQQRYGYGRSGGPSPPCDPLEPKIQGSILLQSILRLPAPHNQIVIDSINSLPIDNRIRIAHNSSSSRVYDALLESSTVLPKIKRQFVMDFIGHYHELVDDKIGSRVGDRCWAFADTYLKEKIARSMFEYEQTLAGSYYGKFFARNLNLYLLQRKPEEWRNMQSEKKRQQDQANAALAISPKVEVVATTTPSTESTSKRKRKTRPDDEIEALFDATLGNKIKKAALAADHVPPAAMEPPPPKTKSSKKKRTEDKELDAVLGAIRAAPKSEEKHGKKRMT
ncbi:armadillo-type protein [Crucibulum laeve]|uniref:Nucleolar protein 9 n=1 Tax=Crucibulum laeve TaxID=68775 RepID=A0A5C3M1Y2_9AGAR|nr:armadillo-type protein [Crucibulum laeve]